MKRLIARTGPALSIALATAGVAAGMYVGMVTPPLSGGTLAGLALVAVFGSIAVRVIHVKNRQRTALTAPRPGVWCSVNDELCDRCVSTEDLRRRVAAQVGVLRAEGIR